MGKEVFHFWLAHFAGMAFVVEKDMTPNRLDIGLVRRDLSRARERVLVVGAGGDILVANAVKDGFFEDKHVEGTGLEIVGSNGYRRNFPMSFTFWVTDAGVEFIRRYPSGLDISS